MVQEDIGWHNRKFHIFFNHFISMVLKLNICFVNHYFIVVVVLFTTFQNNVYLGKFYSIYKVKIMNKLFPPWKVLFNKQLVGFIFIWSIKGHLPSHKEIWLKSCNCIFSPNGYLRRISFPKGISIAKMNRFGIQARCALIRSSVGN